MAKAKITVVTEVGTFTRTTARTYTHLVAVGPTKFEHLEAVRLAKIASSRKEAARYRQVIATGRDTTDRPGSDFDRSFTAKSLADGSFAKWAADLEAAADQLEAQGPITEDGGGWTVAGWSGRLDLAVAVAKAQKDVYRGVAIFDVATGAKVGGR